MSITEGMQAAAGDALLKYLGPESPFRNVFMALATLVILASAYRVTRRRLVDYLERQAHKSENAEQFLRGCDIVYKVLVAIFVLVAASGSFPLLGLSVALCRSGDWLPGS
jgi:hypothetical protein